MELTLLQKNVILREALSKLEHELRKAGSIDMEVYQRQRDHQLAAEFIKLADHAQTALTESN